MLCYPLTCSLTQHVLLLHLSCSVSVHNKHQQQHQQQQRISGLIEHWCCFRQEFTDAWQKVALASNFNELSQQSQHQSDAQTSFMLRQTPLCEAAYRCYFSNDYNLREAFPHEQVIDLLEKVADKTLNTSAKTLMRGAFNQGTSCHAHVYFSLH